MVLFVCRVVVERTLVYVIVFELWTGRGVANQGGLQKQSDKYVEVFFSISIVIHVVESVELCIPMIF